MDVQKNCSLKKHNEIDAVIYCQECNINMCNKCSNHHSELFENHIVYQIGKEKINSGLCKEESHKSELKFYCKNHNILCCGICITKIKGNGFGQHSDCDICMIEKIADEKINKLEGNRKYLEDISLKVTNSVNELKKLVNKIDENKQELKIKVSKIFTKLRNVINEREDKLLLDIDKIFNESFFDEKIVKQSEKLPKKIKENLDKGKKLEKEQGDGVKKLNLIINDCIDIENSITMIKKMEDIIKKCNT